MEEEIETIRNQKSIFAQNGQNNQAIEQNEAIEVIEHITNQQNWHMGNEHIEPAISSVQPNRVDSLQSTTNPAQRTFYQEETRENHNPQQNSHENRQIDNENQMVRNLFNYIEISSDHDHDHSGELRTVQQKEVKIQEQMPVSQHLEIQKNPNQDPNSKNIIQILNLDQTLNEDRIQIQNQTYSQQQLTPQQRLKLQRLIQINQSVSNIARNCGVKNVSYNLCSQDQCKKILNYQNQTVKLDIEKDNILIYRCSNQKCTANFLFHWNSDRNNFQIVGRQDSHTFHEQTEEAVNKPESTSENQNQKLIQSNKNHISQYQQYQTQKVWQIQQQKKQKDQKQLVQRQLSYKVNHTHGKAQKSAQKNIVQAQKRQTNSQIQRPSVYEECKEKRLLNSARQQIPQKQNGKFYPCSQQQLKDKIVSFMKQMKFTAINIQALRALKTQFNVTFERLEQLFDVKKLEETLKLQLKKVQNISVKVVKENKQRSDSSRSSQFDSSSWNKNRIAKDGTLKRNKEVSFRSNQMEEQNYSENSVKKDKLKWSSSDEQKDQTSSKNTFNKQKRQNQKIKNHQKIAGNPRKIFKAQTPSPKNQKENKKSNFSQGSDDYQSVQQQAQQYQECQLSSASIQNGGQHNGVIDQTNSQSSDQEDPASESSQKMDSEQHETFSQKVRKMKKQVKQRKTLEASSSSSRELRPRKKTTQLTDSQTKQKHRQVQEKVQNMLKNLIRIKLKENSSISKHVPLLELPMPAKKQIRRTKQSKKRKQTSQQEQVEDEASSDSFLKKNNKTLFESQSNQKQDDQYFPTKKAMRQNQKQSKNSMIEQEQKVREMQVHIRKQRQRQKTRQKNLQQQQQSEKQRQRQNVQAKQQQTKKQRQRQRQKIYLKQQIIQSIRNAQKSKPQRAINELEQRYVNFFKVHQIIKPFITIGIFRKQFGQCTDSQFWNYWENYKIGGIYTSMKRDQNIIAGLSKSDQTQKQEASSANSIIKKKTGDDLKKLYTKEQYEKIEHQTNLQKIKKYIMAKNINILQYTQHDVPNSKFTNLVLDILSEVQIKDRKKVIQILMKINDVQAQKAWKNHLEESGIQNKQWFVSMDQNQEDPQKRLDDLMLTLLVDKEMKKQYQRFGDCIKFQIVEKFFKTSFKDFDMSVFKFSQSNVKQWHLALFSGVNDNNMPVIFGVGIMKNLGRKSYENLINKFLDIMNKEPFTLITDNRYVEITQAINKIMSNGRFTGNHLFQHYYFINSLKGIIQSQIAETKRNEILKILVNASRNRKEEFNNTMKKLESLGSNDVVKLLKENKQRYCIGYMKIPSFIGINLLSSKQSMVVKQIIRQYDSIIEKGIYLGSISYQDRQKMRTKKLCLSFIEGVKLIQKANNRIISHKELLTTHEQQQSQASINQLMKSSQQYCDNDSGLLQVRNRVGDKTFSYFFKKYKAAISLKFQCFTKRQYMHSHREISPSFFQDRFESKTEDSLTLLEQGIKQSQQILQFLDKDNIYEFAQPKRVLVKNRQCECQSFIHRGLPCEHILSIAIKNKIPYLWILRNRWIKKLENLSNQTNNLKKEKI